MKMQALSLADALFILHALSIISKAQIETRFRSFYSRGCASAASDEESELIDRKVRASARLIIHSLSLAAYTLPRFITDAPIYTFDRCFDNENIVSFTDKLAYLPAFLWAASSFVEARQGKVGSRRDGGAGEGADMMAHHYINIFLTSASYMANKQCYGTSFLAVHAIVEPIHDWYRLCQCGIGSFIPGFRVASEASLAAVWIYTRCYMHYMVLMAPMIARVPYDSAVLLAIHALMWAMFLLQLYWGGIMVQKAVLKFVLGKKDVTKLPSKHKSPKVSVAKK